MTRFARFGKRNKVPHDATDWTEMKEGDKNAEAVVKTEDKKSDASHSTDMKKREIIAESVVKTGNEENDTSKQDASGKSPLRGVMKGKVHKKSKDKNDTGIITKGQKKNSKFTKGQKRDPSDMECYNCHKKGHRVSECTEPSDGKQEIECRKCKKKGHKAFKCPEALENMKCYNCHKKGHRASECSEPSEGKQLEIECHKCKKKGHKASKCPEGKQKRQATQQKGPDAQQNVQKKDKVTEFDQKKTEETKAKRREHRRKKRQFDFQATRVMNCNQWYTLGSLCSQKYNL